MRGGKKFAALALAGVMAVTPGLAYAAPANKAITVAPGEEIAIAGGIAQHLCSAAAPGVDKKGNHYLLTAGHCVEGKLGELLGRVVYYKDKPIGYVYAAQFSLVDYALIRLFNNVRVATNDVPHRADLRPATVGDRICFHGKASGRRCGTVARIRVTAFERGGIIPTVVQVNVGNLQAKQGDSGAAVYSSRGVVGLLSSGDDKTIGYVPISNFYGAISKYVPGFTIG